MKAHFSALILFILFSLNASAQADREDVIYLKNGTIYRGTIIEQIFNVSYKIELRDSTTITAYAEDIKKITKEVKAAPTTSTLKQFTDSSSKIDIYTEHMYKDKGYFFEFQFHLDAIGGGLRMINGYKINQYATLGLGMGFGGIYLPVNGHTINNDAAPYAGFYFPFFLYYSGDLLKKKQHPSMYWRLAMLWLTIRFRVAQTALLT